ncbi:type II secretion system (T2SS), F family protein, partial [Vibrio parahaemolyticus V-223/04]
NALKPRCAIRRSLSYLLPSPCSF